jgi:hypothetical protein
MPYNPAGFAALAVLSLPAMGLAPTTTRYRIDQSLFQEIDATAAGGAKQVISLKGDSTTPIPAAVLDSARGAEFRGFVERSGRPTGLQPVHGTSAIAQVQGLLSDFYPWSKAGIKVGQHWSDTTARVNGVGADSVTVRRVSAYKAAPTENRQPRNAVMIIEDFSSSIEGTQPTPSGSARIEGTGSGKGSYYLGSDGKYLGGTWQHHSSLKISGSFAPEPLPITITQKTKVTTLK